jgi:hypothetical protein
MRIDNTVLARWRELDAAVVLAAIADHAKEDRTFAPTKNPATSRWNATVGGREFELLLTGPKFWDSRSTTGGGGAVDLVMYLVGTDFARATRMLQALQL